MKDWEIISDDLSKAGWSWGCVSAVDRDGRAIWIVDAHREASGSLYTPMLTHRDDNRKRSVGRAEEKLTAFLNSNSVIRNGQRLAGVIG